MERLFHESIVDLIPLFSAAETNLKLDLTSSKLRIKDIISKIGILNPIFSFPSLDISNKLEHSHGNKKGQLHEAFSQKLSTPVEYNSESVVDAPKTLLHNISLTFLNLLESRMHNSTQANRNHATSPDEERNVMIEILSSSTKKIVSITSMLTRFRVQSSTDDTKSDESTKNIHQKDKVLQTAIIFEFCMDLKLLSTVPVTVQLSVTGSALSSIGDTQTNHRCCISTITIDTPSLLRGLVSEAHRVCNALIETASLSALSDLGNRSTCQSTPNRDPNDDLETDIHQSVSQYDNNAGSEAVEQTFIDMPPPPPRKKPTQRDNE
jgi:hypothetical protein